MIKKALDEKYFYQIDEHNIVHLFRGEDDCQQYLTNPLLGAIFKIETLEKENAELEMSLKIERQNKSNVFAELNDETAQSNEMLMNEVIDLEKENAELKEELEIQKRINKEMITSALDGIIKQFTKAKELLKKCYNTYVYEMSVRREIEQLLKENE